MGLALLLSNLEFRVPEMGKGYLAYVEELELVEHTLSTIQQSAITLAKLPVEEREEAFILLFRTYALALGEDTPAAAQWVESVMLGIRELVAEIDNNGGRYLTVKPRLM